MDEVVSFMRGKRINIDELRAELEQYIDSHTPIISEDASLDLIASGIISGGMIPKVQACLAVVREGVQAQIVDGQRAGVLLNLADQGTSFEIKSG